MQVAWLQRFDLDLTTIKVLIPSLEKKLKKGVIQEIKKSDLKQNVFHERVKINVFYCSDGHDGVANWCVALINQVEDKKELRKKELYWINKLNTWAPVGLNVREVCEAY